MTDGLRDVHRTAIVDLLRANQRVERAVLFGSRAMQTFTDGSDVDIALFGKSLTTSDLARLAAAMEQLTIPQRVDLLLHDRVEDAKLRKHVQQDGIELYRRQQSATPAHLDLQERHCQLILSLLRKHLPGVEAWAYGSRVNCHSHDGRDLNLVLRAPGLKKIPTVQLTGLIDALSESKIPFLVRAQDWAMLPERVRVGIVQHHVALGDNAASADKRFAAWATATIEEIAEKVGMGPFGSSIKVETFVPSGIPIINGQHLHGHRVDDSPGFNFITEEHATKLANAIVEPGDIVFTHRGTIGQVAYVPPNSRFDRYVVSQSQFFLRCDLSKAIPGFVVAYFNSPQGKHKLLANASQVGVPSIAQPVTYLRTIDIPVPPLAEQRAIAEILGTLDDKIELNRRMNETLEAMARAIFKDWFVDFGPTRAKADGRAPYLAPELWDLFPDALDDEDRPVGWEEKPLLSFLDIVGGGTPKTKVAEYWGGEIPWFSVVDSPRKGGVYVRSTEKTISERGLAESSARLVPAGTTIVTARGTVGKIAIAAHQMTFNQSCYALCAQAPVGHIFAYLVVGRMVERLRAMAHGSVFSTITRTTFESLTFPWVGERLFNAFEELLEPIFSKINSNGAESQTLAQTRDLLLPKLMSGEIRLSQAEIHQEGAA